MGCERPGGPIIDMVRDAHIKFPPNWTKELPPPMNREGLRGQLFIEFERRHLSGQQIEEAIDFFEQYEMRYYEVCGDGATYHRACGGGAMAQGNTGIFCAKCGKLPDLIPPEFLR